MVDKTSPLTLPIIQVALPVPLPRLFDYLAPPVGSKPLYPGSRVKVPFGNKKELLTGIALQHSEQSAWPLSALKTITAVEDDAPLYSSHLLQLATWLADYYHYPIGEVLATMMPQGRSSRKATDAAFLKMQMAMRAEAQALTKKPKTQAPTRSVEQSSVTTASAPLFSTEQVPVTTASAPTLSAEQAQVVHAVCSQPGFQTFVLAGVTGSGKTEVYLQIIAQVLERGQQALVLVPEIGLTPQTSARFYTRFPGVPLLVFHSRLTPKQRQLHTLYTATETPQIVIGTRSALFSPLPRLGVIILDESHDSSFKQQNALRYSANDVAVMRARLLNIPVVLGSATPTLETLYNVQKNKFVQFNLTQRLVQKSALPTLTLVDLRACKLQGGLSAQTLVCIRQHLQAAGQILLFLNRRGYAPLIMCHQCGWTADCSACDAKLVYHYDTRHLHCHHCGKVTPYPKQCGKGHPNSFWEIGQGTERLAEVIQTQFPTARCCRFDQDNIRKKGEMERLLAQVQAHEVDILIGTQMLAKGHHFPRLSLVVIVDADAGLYSADFRATERMGQLLLQVAGRAGRESDQGEVLIQTHHPDHPLFQCLWNEGYARFAQTLLHERKQALMPPFSHLAILRVEAKKTANLHDFLQKIRVKMDAEPLHAETTRLWGPIASPMARKAGWHRAQLILQSTHRPHLHARLKQLESILFSLKGSSTLRWGLDIDPLEID